MLAKALEIPMSALFLFDHDEADPKILARPLKAGILAGVTGGARIDPWSLALGENHKKAKTAAVNMDRRRQNQLLFCHQSRH